MSYSVSGIYKNQIIENFADSRDLRNFKLKTTETGDEVVTGKYLKEILELKRAHDNGTIANAVADIFKRNDKDISNLKKILLIKLLI